MRVILKQVYIRIYTQIQHPRFSIVIKWCGKKRVINDSDFEFEFNFAYVHTFL